VDLLILKFLLFNRNWMLNGMGLFHQFFAKEDRVRLARKDLYKNSLRKAGHAWKTILEQGLTGMFLSFLLESL
jgi:hypothetical protein